VGAGSAHRARRAQRTGRETAAGKVSARHRLFCFDGILRAGYTGASLTSEIFMLVRSASMMAAIALVASPVLAQTSAEG
ncbi:hypothetical protein C1X43_34905, partial [Pseudomonas sp. GW460-C3]